MSSALCPQPVVSVPLNTDTQSPLFLRLQRFTKCHILLVAQEPMGDFLSSPLNTVLGWLPCVRDLGGCCRDPEEQLTWPAASGWLQGSACTLRPKRECNLFLFPSFSSLTRVIGAVSPGSRHCPSCDCQTSKLRPRFCGVE